MCRSVGDDSHDVMSSFVFGRVDFFLPFTHLSIGIGMCSVHCTCVGLCAGKVVFLFKWFLYQQASHSFFHLHSFDGTVL